jgi:hypothetical protein
LIPGAALPRMGVCEKPSRWASGMRTETPFTMLSNAPVRVGNISLLLRVKWGVRPDTLTNGDWVFVLLGSRMPLFLRRVARNSICHGEELEVLVSTGHETGHKTRCFSKYRTFELLGDAYVHGFMNYETGMRKDPMWEKVFLTRFLRLYVSNRHRGVRKRALT